jgi:polysaccharide biosynthesis protein PslF
MKICFVSSFPPRSDGISEFNQSLIKNLIQNHPNFSWFGVAVNESSIERKKYTDKNIIFQIRRDEKLDYLKAAEVIKESGVDLVCIQLEFALFGGWDGSFLKDLICHLNKKCVIVVHGMPINSYSRRKLTREHFFKNIQKYVSGFVLINPEGVRVLNKWGIQAHKIHIWHGYPDEINNYQQDKCRKELGLSLQDLIIFNFGLFHKHKGLENLIKGYFQFKHENYNAKLIIAGKSLDTKESIDYMLKIGRLADSDTFGNKVFFINEFLIHSMLYKYLVAADVIVLPYIKRNLFSSGPLSFAVGANKFIITTPFPYAKELFKNEEVYFVPYESPKSICRGLIYYSQNRDTKVKLMKEKLLFLSNEIKWSKIADKYYDFFEKIVRGVRIKG